MKPKTILITGATSGLGYETAKQLHIDGHNLILANRNLEKAKRVEQELLDLNQKGTIDLQTVDLSSFSSIKKFSKSILLKYDKIDILINNAGVFSRRDVYTEEGFELALGVNYLGTYYLTELLLPILKQTPNSKIIMVSSLGSYYGRLKLDRSFFNKKTSNFRDYFNSKLANLIYTMQLKALYPEITVKAADPGVAYSNIWKWKNVIGRVINGLYKLLFKSAKKASRAILQLCDDIYDQEDNILYKYKKSLRLPKKSRDNKFNDDFIRLTDNVIGDNI